MGGKKTVFFKADRHGEVTWLKAAASVPSMNCVELANTDEGIALRDSKSPGQHALLFTRAEIAAFVDGARRGEFDHLT